MAAATDHRFAVGQRVNQHGHLTASLGKGPAAGYAQYIGHRIGAYGGLIFGEVKMNEPRFRDGVYMAIFCIAYLAVEILLFSFIL